MPPRRTDSVAVAAAEASMSQATGHRIAKKARLPSTGKASRGRRRPDPLGDLFEDEVVPMLRASPGLRPAAVFEEVVRRHPELGTGSRRTLERRVRICRAVNGPEQDASSASPPIATPTRFACWSPRLLPPTSRAAPA